MRGKRFLLRSLGFLLGQIFFVAHAETLTIATYNIENYGPADRVTEAGFRADYPKPEAEKAALRRVIRGLNADVLVLQEMGDQPYLDELRHDLKAEGLDYLHSAVASAADADRHLAVLSKRPLKGVTTHTDLTFAYFGAKEDVKRGLLEATIATSGGDVTLFVVHLKSRFTDRPDDPSSEIRRAGEATAIRDAVLKRFPDPSAARFVILGDCNDTKTSRALAHLQTRGKTQVAILLGGTDSHGEVWSHFYRREDTYSRVDHILVSPALLPAVAGNIAHIYDGDGVRDASDHRPLAITLTFPPKK
ncbi:MAG TPA: endonuclease/exonuclease/phosphatase family protein [Opitutaceae bacterium]|nr:endonuclease/exonuclease/phosphatase family protein [Opitutaceae bacterium]